MATELVLVETVSMFRIRYVVEVPEGKKDWALDTVVAEQAKEFSQFHMGESIVSHKVISKKDALALCDEDNPEWKDTHETAKIRCYFTMEEDLKNTP